MTTSRPSTASPAAKAGTASVRVADYIAQALAAHGLQHVFLVTGGGAMHLNDAFGRCKGLSYVACHHEQACAMAAESYTRMSGKLAVLNVTTGPGGTNAITGVWGAWVDSIGMVVVSGQVKWETVVRSTGLPLRQIGDQELDIVKVVEPITKYAVMVTDPKSIRWHLEKALHLAASGRPGPVWLDVPMNVQGSLIDPSSLEGYTPEPEPKTARGPELEAACRQVLERLKKAERPVILAGSGVRVSGAYDKFLELVDRLGIPVTTAFNAHDLIWDEHPLYAGRPGTIGDRPGNFAVQNSDFLLALGSRLSIRQVSYAWDLFARHAYKVMVDVDEAELKKPTLKLDLPVHADLNAFIDTMLALEPAGPTAAHKKYVAWCKERRAKYPVVLPEYWKLADKVNPYCFMDVLFRGLPEGEKVVCADGTACVAAFQAGVIKKGTRLYHNSGCAPMGYDLPAAVGASIATGKGRVICIAGDGSLQMNLQELQTIVTHGLPIKLFILNNQGYHSIRQTQHNYFPDNIVGCGTESGLGFPDYGKLAAAYGLPYRRIANHKELERGIRDTVDGPGAQVCEVVLDLEQQFSPKLSSRKLPDGRMVSSPLEDMWPFLSREELKSNLLIPPVES